MDKELQEVLDKNPELKKVIQIMLVRQNIQKELDDEITLINEDFEHYRDELEIINKRSDKTTAELVRDADMDGIEFNIGFEQGFMRGLEVALSHFND